MKITHTAINTKGDLEFIELIKKTTGYEFIASNSENAVRNSNYCVCINHNGKYLGYSTYPWLYDNEVVNIATKEEFIEKFGTGEKEMGHRGTVHVNGNKDLFIALENLFLSKGFSWSHSNKDWSELSTVNGSKRAAKEHYFYFNLETKNMGGIIDPKKHKVYNINEVFSLFVFKPITVKLNNQYSAVVDKNGIKVGCQIFSHEKIDELHAASLKVRGEI